MAKKVFYFLYNKRNNNLRVRFAQRPTTPQTTEYKLKVTIDGTLFPPAPASVTPDASGNCVFDLNIAGEEPGVWDVEAIPIRNGQPVTNDSIFGNFNTTNPFLRKWAFVTYVVLALLLIGFGAYKWVNRDTSVKKIGKIQLPDRHNDRGNTSPDPSPQSTDPDDSNSNDLPSSSDLGGAYTRTKTGYVVVPVFIPARTQYTRIALKDNNPSSGIEWDDNNDRANPRATPPRANRRSVTLRPSPTQTPVQQDADVTVHTQEVEGINLLPGASYTQATVPKRVLKPVTTAPSAIRITHTGGQRIDALRSTTADTVTIRNISDAPVYVQFQWFDVIDNEPAEK